MINKSLGKTRTESLLAKMCNKTFLDIWSYANPIKDDKKEFCDLIAVFENHMFIFFDREKSIKQDFLANIKINWNRWYRDVIEAQAKSCFGAERYIRSNRQLFLDTELKTKFPLTYNSNTLNIHKFIIANGAKDACKAISDSNINGSLGIAYHDHDAKIENIRFPFTIDLKSRKSGACVQFI